MENPEKHEIHSSNPEHKEHHIASEHHASSPENKVIEERKAKAMNFFKNNPNLIFVLVLIALIILGVYIRSLPLSDHGGKPGLWDITTNDYTLGPDLDPFLFLRYAKDIITTGSLPKIDSFRNVPLGFDTSTELQMVSYMIVLTYKGLNLMGTYSSNFAGAFMPVWVFAFTVMFFFLFVREIFIRKNEKETHLKANLIATIATAFMIVIPEFLSRTVAGIPEKEAIGFCFMFLALYLFLKAWKSEKIIGSSIFSALSAAATALMALSWGGYTYLFITIGLSTLAIFILGKLGKKESIAYLIWFALSVGLILLFTNRFSLIGMITATSNLFATFAFAAISADMIIWNTKLKEIQLLQNIKLPKTVISAIIAVIIAILASFLISPTFLISQAQELNNLLLNPITGRWSTTVAENRQPYLSEWLGNFGKGFFWLFLIGSILLFRKMLGGIENKKAWILTGLYAFFIFGLLFSRYAPHPALFDGEGWQSKLLYYGSALLLVCAFMYFYLKEYRERSDTNFRSIEYEFMLAFVLIVLVLFTARSAIRLIMVVAPIAPIFLSYLIIEPIYMFRKLGKEEKNQTLKIVIGIAIVAILIISMVSFGGFYKSIKQQSYSFTPYYYTYQWQEAMKWVRDNTPTNSVFAHWWDYGYWVQSIGNRATVTDGGNAIVWWNYLTGRLVLTGDNQKDSLNFLYAHNATHLLIDSSDIGKYGAFSQIGSDENLDRLSQGPVTFISDSKQVQEVKDGYIRNYNIPAGEGKVSMVPLEEDLIYIANGTSKTYFKENSAVLGVNVKYATDNDSYLFSQPTMILYNEGKQIEIPMRYMYYNSKIKDFGNGVNATAYLIQRVIPAANGRVQMDPLGAMIYLSPRVMRGFLGQVYVLNDALGNFPNFKLVHNEPDYILNSFNSQGINLGEFTYYEGLRGPIKIWEIKYTGKETINPDYLLTSPPSYITWRF